MMEKYVFYIDFRFRIRISDELLILDRKTLSMAGEEKWSRR